jgi:hypothetical protein
MVPRLALENYRAFHCPGRVLIDAVRDGIRSAHGVVAAP